MDLGRPLQQLHLPALNAREQFLNRWDFEIHQMRPDGFR